MLYRDGPRLPVPMRSTRIQGVIEMTGRKAVIGLSLLCALAASAVTAPNAMAFRTTTAYTCKPVEKPTEQTKGFEDEHCTKPATGTSVTFTHEMIPAEKPTKLKVTNNETLEKYRPAKLTSKIEGTEFEIEASTFQSCNAGKEITDIANFNEVPEKEHAYAQGFFCGEFTGITVKKPANCEVVKKAVILNTDSIFQTIVVPAGEGETMFVYFVPPKGKPFTTFEFGGEKCTLKGKQAVVEGSLAANVQTEGETALLGATLTFDPFDGISVLKVGGEPAAFEGTFTPRMLAETGVPDNPIVLTTEVRA